mmetsp:Transcript_16098/g.24505  ORF Transcript_16098/g.24505 Transcript_16098/m.24505 type:complete len:167 (-) Transcript_16098:190-690(-)|eukprot:CAMPEP_0118702826 /NCGR_PEP_ID=MMETSP0800-20121206/18139_1 /TAXON_ID=210618 ORGANISM="Striatella unipunctata, Strain CCMP2910" /NCGR_SAMPLE_ID=MMETSP0800 /ASSEMBLY_ACC=CAM_ASM_000638 /LENGTH=166 /DNA_ID=CAMNT_0006604135 /DNA_START=42 /DNA_END=542 /DNA_ORIENTATION=+
MATPSLETPDAAQLARRRRKEIIQSQRSTAEAVTTQASDTVSMIATVEENTSNDIMESSNSESDVSLPPPKKRKLVIEQPDLQALEKKKKLQMRYDPDVPMTKEQLAAWRKEARQVRNRESAAASRQRIRDKISELEGQVGEWKQKYQEAMGRLRILENQQQSQSN